LKPIAKNLRLLLCIKTDRASQPAQAPLKLVFDQLQTQESALDVHTTRCTFVAVQIVLLIVQNVIADTLKETNIFE